MKRTTYIIITLAYMLLIAYISLQPVPQGYHSGTAQQAVNNFLHIPAYALLAYFIHKCLLSSKVYSYIVPAIIAISFGAILELLQAAIPGRTASPMDIALNTTGAILSLSFLLLRCHSCVSRNPRSCHPERSEGSRY